MEAVQEASGASRARKQLTTFEAAKLWAARGLHVFPVLAPIFTDDGPVCPCPKGRDCPAVGKHPAVKNWVNRATADPDALGGLFRGRTPGNLGCVPGASGHVVVDVDSEEGEGALRDLWGEIPPTLTWRTGRDGGLHRLYRLPEGTEIRSRTLAPGLDVKSRGGFAALPPSIHKSGRKYTLADTLPITTLTSEQAAALSGGKERRKADPVPDVIPEGYRNETLASLAGTFRARNMTRDAALAALNVQNGACCSPPLDDADVERIVDSIWRYPAGPGAAVVRAEEEFPAEPAPASVVSVRPRLETAAELLGWTPPADQWVLRGTLAKGALSLFAGKAKAGKSTSCRHLSIAVAKGEPWLGRETIRGPVVYLALEGRKAHLQEEMESLGLTPDDPLRFLTQPLRLAPKYVLKWLADEIGETRPHLVVVDTLQRLLHIPNLNDYAQVSDALDPYIAAARDFDTHISFLHHTTKDRPADVEGGIDAFDKILGSTALVGSMDTVLLLSRVRGTDIRTIETRQREGEADWPETVLLLNEFTRQVSLGGPRRVEENARIKAEIVAYLTAEGALERDIMDSVDGDTTKKRKALRDLVAEGAVERTGEGKRGDPYMYNLAREAA